MSLSLGQRIVKYRKKAGFSQKGLAEAAGVTPTALNYYEKGKREPNISIIKNIAKALDITGDALLGIEPQPDLIIQNRDEYTFLHTFRTLNDLGQKRALENVADLSEVPKYANRGVV
ncbi:MAG: helix-turn-helix domain-containing protein [Chitinispirillales bacterium]|jgi:transcriptional regulator with XRE-family HTH domain|nr:helix-turn-helix domain-containing protein [Chitinispirillales bacterium]